MVTDVPIRSRLFICKLSCFQMIAGISKITGMGKTGINAYPWVYPSLLQESLTERANRSARAGMVVLGRCGIAGGAGTGERLWGWQELPAQYQPWALPMPHVLLFWIPRRETARKSLALGRRVILVGSKRVQRESPRPAGAISRAGCQHLCGPCHPRHGSVWASWVWASGLPARAGGDIPPCVWGCLGIRVSCLTSVLFSDKKSPSLPRKWFTGICYFITGVAILSYSLKLWEIKCTEWNPPPHSVFF